MQSLPNAHRELLMRCEIHVAFEMITDDYLIRFYSEEAFETLLITCRHYHRAGLGDSMAVIKLAAVIIRRNG